jgi:hypothetical protein
LAETAPAAVAAPALELSASRQFTAWLAEQRLALACTTYQAGKLFLLGLQSDGRLALFERSFDRAMGLAAHGRQLYLSTLYQLWRFDDTLRPGQVHQGHDRLYVPQLAWTTGDLDIHDVAVRADERVVFVNTLFSCLAEPSEGHSFAPLWQPPWITRLAAEDHCHLNGLALVDGRPAFATAISRSDVTGGWRDRRRDGGVVVRVPDGEVVLAGLSMPHSPRWHQGRLWLLTAAVAGSATSTRRAIASPASRVRTSTASAASSIHFREAHNRTDTVCSSILTAPNRFVVRAVGAWVSVSHSAAQPAVSKLVDQLEVPSGTVTGRQRATKPLVSRTMPRICEACCAGAQ